MVHRRSERLAHLEKAGGLLISNRASSSLIELGLGSFESNLSRLGPATDSAMAVRQPLRKLSRRQLQVMRLVTEGLTSKEIAEGLGLSIKTVEAHRSAGMRRLGVADITGLVRYAVRVGLIPQGLSSSGTANDAGTRRVAASARQTPLQFAGD